MDRRHQLRGYLHKWRMADGDTTHTRFALDAKWLNDQLRLEGEEVTKEAVWTVDAWKYLAAISEPVREAHYARLTQRLGQEE